MKGQICLIKKAPIWHYSLNHVWEECPSCKSYNVCCNYNYRFKCYEYYDECPVCGQPLDWSDEAIEKSAKYSKDYPRN